MSADAVRVWLVGADMPEPAMAYLFDVLDQEERDRAAVFQRSRDRHRFIVAHGATRCIVGEHLGAPPHELRWVRGRHGKPELAGTWTGAQVNLSHSGEFSMVAVSASRHVGVDIQHLLPDLDVAAMATRYFPPDEARYVATGADADGRAARFARLWARKEAIIKAGGGRLFPGLRIPVLGPTEAVVDYPDEDSSRPFRISDVPAPRGFRAAVALADDDDYQVDLRRWSGPVTQPAR